MRSLSRLVVISAAFCLLCGCESNSRKAKSAMPAVGQLAPEIDGEDLDGKNFKLSEYKGKVVLLDFWGMWCPPCRAFLPHGKQIVQQYKGRPFVALGVNTDDDLELPKKSKDLAMRCWADRG